ncbi:MAG TPA: TolC family outer membrane protein [Spongiibacteraceae bacterium]|nr:TolC family outer membrane protein [Spongiibacteraceae bacterium]HUH36853.1 TolC family outer membrane protein [Spongiibacteraceae bacterium]
MSHRRYAKLACCILLSAAFGATAQADTLRDIYELALKNDAKLKVAEATYKANLEIENQTFSALLPQVTGEASYRDSDTDTNNIGVLSNPTPPPDFNLGRISTNLDTTTKSYGVSVTQALFDMSAWFDFKRGKQISKQAEAQFAYDQQDLIVRTAEAYFNVLRELDNLQASRAEERAAQRQLEQTQQRFDVGLIAITDVHEARAVYDNTVVRRLTDEGNVGTAYEVLTLLTNQPHSNLWLLNKDFPVVSPDPSERGDWVQFALANNYALQAAIYGEEAARQHASSRKMEHLPTVTGAFNYADDTVDGSRTSRPGSLFSTPPDSDSESTVWSINLQVPLFTGGRISSQRRQAYEQYNASLQQRIDTQRTVVQSTRALHILVNTDVERVKARRQAIVSSESALEATQAGYEVGTRNIVDVLEAQRVLYQAIRDYANARYDYVVNLLKLKRQSGILNPQDIYALDNWLLAPDAPKASIYEDFNT